MSKFLHTLQEAAEHNHYLINDRIWRGWNLGIGDYVTAEVEGARLSVSPSYDGQRYCWEYSRCLSEKITFRHRGVAEKLEEACCAALSFMPEFQVFEYLGQTYDCYGSTHAGRTTWTFVVDGDEVEVTGPLDFYDDFRYTWRRPWSPAENLLKTYCNAAGCLEGRGHTMLEAMVAAVNAPEAYRRSCAELIAVLYRLPEGGSGHHRQGH